MPIAYIALLTAAMLLFTACGAPADEVVSSAASQTVQQQTPAHAAMTEELKALLDADPELMALMEKSLAAAAAINPDPDTNPAQGVWSIDENGELVQREGVQIKSANFTSIRQLIGEDSAYADAFAGGTLTHTFLDVNDYHRYHFPIDGTVVEVRKIPGTNAAGGVTVWDADTGRYVLEDTIPGWQMIETRDCVILDTEYGLVAILPIGMSQICSCNWEESVQVGAEVKRGDPMGYFLFGGSDIVMVFQRQVEFDLLVPEDGAGGLQHRLMGEAYAELSLM
uniref:phosphatidylserine decarboxylase n=1 Tax=Gemmiger formicilis TaxID=745368 RepID=UPI003FEE6BFE